MFNIFKRKVTPSPEAPKELYIDFDIWPGHKVYQYDKISDTVTLAEVSTKVYVNKTVHTVTVKGEQYIYISALNASGALKKCRKHLNPPPAQVPG